jgi:hypothetical protein
MESDNSNATLKGLLALRLSRVTLELYRRRASTEE